MFSSEEDKKFQSLVDSIRSMMPGYCEDISEYEPSEKEKFKNLVESARRMMEAETTDPPQPLQPVNAGPFGLDWEQIKKWLECNHMMNQIGAAQDILDSYLVSKQQCMMDCNNNCWFNSHCLTLMDDPSYHQECINRCIAGCTESCGAIWDEEIAQQQAEVERLQALLAEMDCGVVVDKSMHRPESKPTIGGISALPKGGVMGNTRGSRGL